MGCGLRAKLERTAWPSFDDESCMYGRLSSWTTRRPLFRVAQASPPIINLTRRRELRGTEIKILCLRRFGYIAAARLDRHLSSPFQAGQTWVALKLLITIDPSRHLSTRIFNLCTAQIGLKLEQTVAAPSRQRLNLVKPFRGSSMPQ